MWIDKGASVAVVVKRTWANLHGVRMFLRQSESSQPEIRGVDDSHIIFAKVLNSEDPKGVWIETTEKHTKDPGTDQFRLLIPWSEILTIVTAAKFSQAIRQEARKIGFTEETERE